MKLRLVVRACVLLFAFFAPEMAQASNCYIREYTVPGISRGLVVQIAQETGLDQTPVVIGGSSASSAAFKSSTNIVRVVCGANASFNFGVSPTATTSNSYLPAGLPEYFAVSSGQGWSIAFISNASP